MRAFRRLKIQVPEGIAVIGWGDLQFADLYDPPMASVADDLPAILEAALDATLSQDLVPPVHRRVSTRLVSRQSAELQPGR